MSIVLDTTFILPIFNIQTKSFTKKDLKTLINTKFELIINQALIIEAKWVLLALIKKGVIEDIDSAYEDFNMGLRFIKYSNRFKFVDILDENVDLKENYISKTIGIKDYFDRLALATAQTYGEILLTEDKEILNLRDKKTKKLGDTTILNWSEFKTKHIQKTN